MGNKTCCTSSTLLSDLVVILSLALLLTARGLGSLAYIIARSTMTTKNNMNLIT